MEPEWPDEPGQDRRFDEVKALVVRYAGLQAEVRHRLAEIEDEGTTRIQVLEPPRVPMGLLRRIRAAHAVAGLAFVMSVIDTGPIPYGGIAVGLVGHLDFFVCRPLFQRYGVRGVLLSRQRTLERERQRLPLVEVGTIVADTPASQVTAQAVIELQEQMRQTMEELFAQELALGTDVATAGFPAHRQAFGPFEQVPENMRQLVAHTLVQVSLYRQDVLHNGGVLSDQYLLELDPPPEREIYRLAIGRICTYAQKQVGVPIGTALVPKSDPLFERLLAGSRLKNGSEIGSGIHIEIDFGGPI